MYYFLALFAFILVYATTSAFLDPSNPPPARTGAPNETTCAASGCHSGGNFTGTVAITGIPDTITPGQAYTVNLTQTSNAARAGFELTCLDGTNTRCGTLTAGSGGNVTSSGGRQYIRQSSARNLSNGSVSWSFTWTAPDSLDNNNITFYFVSLAANGNGGKTGDNVLINTFNAVLQEPEVIDTNTVDIVPAFFAEKTIHIYPTPANNTLSVNLPANSNKGQITLYDLRGAAILSIDLPTPTTSVDITQLPKGIYIAKIQANGKTWSERITKQ